VQLNGQFEGSASGETFNSQGKTDILIREGNRNVFIAECKFWRGPKSYANTIDQVLSYLSWRDTKAAILVLFRDEKFTSMLADAQETVQAHSNFDGGLVPYGEAGFRCGLRQADDPERKLVLTTLAFHIPRASTA